jgi:hypothetical protein
VQKTSDEIVENYYEQDQILGFEVQRLIIEIIVTPVTMELVASSGSTGSPVARHP